MAHHQLAQRHERKAQGSFCCCPRAGCRRTTAADPGQRSATSAWGGGLAHRRTQDVRREEILSRQPAGEDRPAHLSRHHQGTLDLRAGSPAAERRTRSRSLRGAILARASPSRAYDNDRLRLPPAPPSRNSEAEKKESTARRLSQLCPPCATQSSNSSLDCRRSDARIVENGCAPSGGVSKSAKVVLVDLPIICCGASSTPIDCFGEMEAEAITVADCRAHIDSRRKRGIKDGTLLTELGHLRMVLKWAEKHKLIDRAPHIERPPQPRPKEDKHLTRDEVRRLIANSALPHVRLAVILLYTTAARSAALRRLTWERCDFEREQMDLREPTITRPHKGRAIVPMLRTAKAALLEAQAGAISSYVIEWGGKPVGSLKRGLKRSAALAGIKKSVSPHVLRHSAAVHMAEDDVSMEKIAQFLGHSNVNTTRKIYARFSPSYLKDAAAALELDDLGSMNRKITTSRRVK